MQEYPLFSVYADPKVYSETIYVCVYIYIHIHVYIYTYTCVYIYIYMSINSLLSTPSPRFLQGVEYSHKLLVLSIEVTGV